MMNCPNDRSVGFGRKAEFLTPVTDQKKTTSLREEYNLLEDGIWKLRQVINNVILFYSS